MCCKKHNQVARGSFSGFVVVVVGTFEINFLIRALAFRFNASNFEDFFFPTEEGGLMEEPTGEERSIRTSLVLISQKIR